MMLFVWLAPLPVAFRAAEMLGWFAFQVLRIRRSVVMKNLSMAFPQKSDAEKRAIGLAAYQNFGKFVMEYMRIPYEKKQTVLASRDIGGLEHIREGLEKGKGVVVVGGHFGNFESMGSMVPVLGFPTSFLVGRQHNAMVDEIINRYRALSGAEIIRRGVAVRGALKALRNNRVLIFLSDQNIRKDGVFVNFFGIPAATPQGAAAFAIKTGARLVFGADTPVGKGRHRLVYTHCPTGQYDKATPENIQKVTQAYASILESYVREYPEHYFWMHKRWKTRPPGEQKKFY